MSVLLLRSFQRVAAHFDGIGIESFKARARATDPCHSFHACDETALQNQLDG